MSRDRDPGTAKTADDGPSGSADELAETATELAETAAPSWWDSRERASAGPHIEPPEVSPSNYEILGEHGRGGLGRVMRARDLRTGRIVAIKEILRGSVSALQRFRREALVTANLQHPAIVPVYEVGRWPDGQPFFAMKLVDGVPLSHAIREAADATARLALLPHVIQVADALGYAHAQGWIHRDLKPGNVLVGAFGETVVIDWGLAKRVREAADESSQDSLPSGDDGATVDGQVLGTPVYMPPEQARGDALDARADVYAIGALLYHVLAGSPPYHEARNTAEVIARVTAGPPTPLVELAPGLPPELYTIVGRAMAHRADQRYPSARELALDLGRHRAGNLVASHSYTARQLLSRWLRRHRTTVGVAALAALALAVIGVVSFRENLAARRRAEAERVRADAARVIAEERTGEAEARLGALHTELGLREMAAGSPARALPYLADAYRRAPGATVTRFLLGRALESVAPLEQAMAAPGIVSGFGFGGGRAIALSLVATPVLDLDGRRRLIDAAGQHGALSPDGTWVVTRSPDGQTLIMFDVASGAERARRPLDGNAVALELAVDAGGRVVMVDGDGVVAIFDATLAPQQTARAPFAPHTAAIAPTGRVLVGGPGGQLWVWDPGRGVILDDPRAHEGQVGRLCVADDGATWLSMDARSTRVWRDAVPAVRVAHDGRAAACDVDAAGRRAVTLVADHPPRIWDLTVAAPAATELVTTVTSAEIAAIAPDGAMIALGGGRGEIELIAAGGASLGRFVAHAAPVASIAVSPDGKHVLSATAAGDVRVWRRAAAAQVIAVELGERGWGGTFVDDLRAVVVGTAGARLIDAADGRVHAELAGHRDAVVFASASADGARVATASRDHTGRLWTGDGTLVAELAVHDDRVRRVEVSRDGARVLTASKDGTFAIWRGRDGALERRVKAQASLWTARLSADGQRVVTLLDGMVVATLWDAESGQQLADLPVLGMQPVDAAFSSDGALVAVASAGPTAPVYDGRTGTPRFEVQHEAHVLAVTWSRDGELLATGDASGVVRLTRRDGTRVRSFQVEGAIASVAVRGDGAVIAVGTEVGDVIVLDVGAGRELARLAHAPGAATVATVVYLEFSPGGGKLMIGQAGPGVRVWQLGDWTGSADELDRTLRCAVPFRLDADGLATAVPDPAACR